MYLRFTDSNHRGYAGHVLRPRIAHACESSAAKCHSPLYALRYPCSLRVHGTMMDVHWFGSLDRRHRTLGTDSERKVQYLTTSLGFLDSTPATSKSALPSHAIRNNEYFYLRKASRGRYRDVYNDGYSHCALTNRAFSDVDFVGVPPTMRISRSFYRFVRKKRQFPGDYLIVLTSPMRKYRPSKQLKRGT